MFDVRRLVKLAPKDALIELKIAVASGELEVKEALEVAKALSFPEELRADLALSSFVIGTYGDGVVPTTERRRAPAINVMSLRSSEHALGRILPSPGQAYPIQARWRGREHSFELRFGAALIAAMRVEGLRVDLTTGEIVDAKGRPDPRCQTARARRAFKKLVGEEAPPWIFMHPEAGSFCWPKKELLLDLGAHALRLQTSGGLRLLFSHHRDDVQSSGTASSSRTPLTAWKPARAALGDVGIEAESKESIERAKVVFESVCGKLHAGWPERRAKLEAERAELIALAKGLATTFEPLARAELMARAMELCTVSTETEQLDLRGAIEARREQIDRALAPVKIVVVPEGKHYTAMPELAHLREALKDQRGDAASIVCDDPKSGALVRFLFVPAADLAGEAGTAKHELYHLLEDRYLSEDALAAIDRLYFALAKRGGPFARAYGMQRSEFVTTMAEELEGVWGKDGPAWLKKNHPELYEILANATGRT